MAKNRVTNHLNTTTRSHEDNVKWATLIARFARALSLLHGVDTNFTGLQFADALLKKDAYIELSCKELMDHSDHAGSVVFKLKKTEAIKREYNEILTSYSIPRPTSNFVWNLPNEMSGTIKVSVQPFLDANKLDVFEEIVKKLEFRDRNFTLGKAGVGAIGVSATFDGLRRLLRERLTTTDTVVAPTELIAGPVATFAAATAKILPHRQKATSANWKAFVTATTSELDQSR